MFYVIELSGDVRNWRLSLPSEGRGQRFESSRVRHKINDLRETFSQRMECVWKTGGRNAQSGTYAFGPFRYRSSNWASLPKAINASRITPVKAAKTFQIYALKGPSAAEPM
jgi:hypothetical protein